MRVLVCGGRRTGADKIQDDRAWMARVLGTLHEEAGIEILIEGGAAGYDKLGKEWAVGNGVDVWEFVAEWFDISHPEALIKRNPVGLYDARAGLRRNQQMIDEGKPDLVIAFPGGKGTADMIRRAKKAGIVVYEPPRPQKWSEPRH